MSIANHQPLRPPEHANGLRPHSPSNDRSPALREASLMAEGARSLEGGSVAMDGEVGGVEEDPRTAMFRQRFLETESKIADLFGFDDVEVYAFDHDDNVGSMQNKDSGVGKLAPSVKRAAREIDEDDYGDDDEEDDGEEQVMVISNGSPLKGRRDAKESPRPGSAQLGPLPKKPRLEGHKSSGLEDPSKSSEEVRKQLEEDKKAAEDAAKRSFHTQFYTLENDRHAMLEQQKLEDLDRQVEAEMSGNGSGPSGNTSAAIMNEGQGKLSSANLGASSLTLKHLIARIDVKREQVKASDAELRTLMSEVRKNRSKWASPDRVGQEELYEAAEKVLSELKAMTEHSTAFLSRVNKREAPDYYNVIKHPMDLGSMTKKLKSISYKSKQDFVDDLNLIWANCLKYNADPNHYLRKHALAMRKETDKLVPLIPDIVIRDRAEVEAEERRMQNGDAECEVENGEESDDEPIMSSRGRKAPSKKAKKGAAPSRGAPELQDDAANLDHKPLSTSASSSNLKEFARAGSDVPGDALPNGTATPTHGSHGTHTPGLPNGAPSSVPPGDKSDLMDLDGSNSIPAVPGNQSTAGSEAAEFEDLEYKTWKQVTKKDRALVAADRNRLFKNDQLNADEPALLRTKAAMRRWQRKQREAESDGVDNESKSKLDPKSKSTGNETLAEGMEGEDELVLPDYYDPLGAIPELSDRLKWTEDADGQLIDPSEEFLRVLPKGSYTAPESALTQRIHQNMRQMQETRKVCSKIGVVKQMQLQSQTYQNQFQKYNPEPFSETDVPTQVSAEDGPVMNQWATRAALQRSVGEIFYHAGFEEFQPSALEAVTDIAGDYFHGLVQTLQEYREDSKVPVETSTASTENAQQSWRPKYNTEECILHCLDENGLDVNSLELYCSEDVERQGTKLGALHERMRSHLAELLRPALTDAGTDGSNAFKDGSEQFVGGDFAEDINEDFFGFQELGLDKEFGLASMSVPLHLLQNRMNNLYQNQNNNASVSDVTNIDQPPAYEPMTIENLKSQIGLVQNFFLAKLHANNDEPLLEDEDLPQKQRPPKPKLPATGKISSPRKRPLKDGQGGNKAKKKKTEATNNTVTFADLKNISTNAAAAPNGTAEGQAANHTTVNGAGTSASGKQGVSKVNFTNSSLRSNNEPSPGKVGTPDADGEADDMIDPAPPIKKAKPNPRGKSGRGSGSPDGGGKRDNGNAEHQVGMMSPESIVAA